MLKTVVDETLSRKKDNLKKKKIKNAIVESKCVQLN